MDHHYSDGTERLVGFLARPESKGNRPGVVIFHEAPGLADHPKMRAGMLSELGYVVLAADMYGEGRTYLGPEAIAAMNAVRIDSNKLRHRIRAAFDELAGLDGVDPDRLVAIGYCFGGMCALELARSGAPVRAVVSFHGLLETQRPAEPGAVKGAILACTGSADPLVPPEQVEAFGREMSEAGADWQLVNFGGVRHAFTNRNAARSGNPALAYDAAADRRSWAFMLGFLDDVLTERPEEPA